MEPALLKQAKVLKSVTLEKNTQPPISVSTERRTLYAKLKYWKSEAVVLLAALLRPVYTDVTHGRGETT